ncbi:MAG: hypothetical protein FIA94_08755 [Nitrospirae bacterium]|nr:hypothetical protein [Nitrospirota bacterium]
MGNVRGKSTKALTVDVAEGYVAVNPLFLKSFDPDSLKDFYHQLDKTQKELRAERFPTNDAQAIRMRNLKLQRLYSAQMIIRNFARERRVPLI